jgi:hypothetical protein
MPVPEIYESLRDDFVLIAQYTDSQDDPTPAEVFFRYLPEGGSVPIYMILDTKGRELARLTWPADRPNMSKEEFTEFMKKGLERFKELPPGGC